jgi:hypothetical protein
MPSKNKKASKSSAKDESSSIPEDAKNKDDYEDRDVEQRPDETDEAENIYDSDQRDEMLQNDEITSDEAAFMEGNEMANTSAGYKKNKKILESPRHRDTPSVELAEADSERDDATTDTEST